MKNEETVGKIEEIMPLKRHLSFIFSIDSEILSWTVLSHFWNKVPILTGSGYEIFALKLLKRSKDFSLRNENVIMMKWRRASFIEIHIGKSSQFGICSTIALFFISSLLKTLNFTFLNIDFEGVWAIRKFFILREG